MSDTYFKNFEERALCALPGGSSTSSKRLTRRASELQYCVASRAKGANFWDTQNRKWLDFQMGLGSVLLGHSSPEINQAVYDQIGEGQTFSVPSKTEILYAEALLNLYGKYCKIVFAKNGSDSTSAAVRLSRAYTKREVVVTTGYNGWQDWSMAPDKNATGIPLCLRNLTIRATTLEEVLTYLDRYGNSVACVIVEPSQLWPLAKSDLEDLAERCARLKALLVFDEILSGLRFGPKGIVGVFDIYPDLLCIGKALGNGFPISALMGRDEIMSLIPETRFTTTFGTETVSLAAGLAMLRILLERNNWEQLEKLGVNFTRRLKKGLSDLGWSQDLVCVGHPTLAKLIPKNNSEIGKRLISMTCDFLAQHGIFWCGNCVLSFAHTEEEVNSLSTMILEFLEAQRSSKLL